MKTAILVLFLTQAAFAYSDQELVAAVLIGEAGGEGVEGLQAVHEVIITRSQERRLTEAQVVAQKHQFSCLAVGASELVAKGKRHSRWKDALNEAVAPANGNLTRGANHYLAPKRLKKLPSWARGVKSCAVIGGHNFYKL